MEEAGRKKGMNNGDGVGVMWVSLMPYERVG